MKCKHCGAELVPVTLYVDASYLNPTGKMVAAPQPEWWRPVELYQPIDVPNVGASAPCMPSVPVTLCGHEPAPEGEVKA